MQWLEAVIGQAQTPGSKNDQGLVVFVALRTCDRRKGFNGLYALLNERLGQDPRAGAFVVFSNRRYI